MRDSEYTGAREWKVEGEYEYWAVREYWTSTKSPTTTMRTIEMFNTESEATAVANALGRAFALGVERGEHFVIDHNTASCSSCGG